MTILPNQQSTLGFPNMGTKIEQKFGSVPSGSVWDVLVSGDFPSRYGWLQVIVDFSSKAI